MCALKNDIIFLFNQHSVSYLLALQMSFVIYLINNKKFSYHRDSAGRQSVRRSRSLFLATIKGPYATWY